MTGLVDFLTARLDEEQDAAERTQPGPWIASPSAMPGEVEVRHRMPDGRPDVAAVVATTHGLHCAARDADHIARYNPARALAEIKAKRALMELHHKRTVWIESETPSGERCMEPDYVCAECEDEHPCASLRLVALPYSGHPDYRREEFAP